METWTIAKLIAMGRLARSGFCSHIPIKSDLGRYLILLEQGNIAYELIWNTKNPFDIIEVMTKYASGMFYDDGKQLAIYSK